LPAETPATPTEHFGNIRKKPGKLDVCPVSHKSLPASNLQVAEGGLEHPQETSSKTAFSETRGPQNGPLGAADPLTAAANALARLTPEQRAALVALLGGNR
jgi:hypothetical protein